VNFWTVDLTTRAGAEKAAANGGFICLVIAGLVAVGLLALIALGGTTGGSLIIAGAGIAIAGFGIALFVVAGLRLRRGCGAYWGAFAALFLALTTLVRIVSVLVFVWGSSGSAIGAGSIGGIVVNLVLLVPVVNGVRGAWALRRDTFAADLVDVFN
jgi:hypothetical protein